MNRTEAVLELNGICKYFASTKANECISLSAGPGEVRGFAGENGSGKSTLMSVVAGVYQKDGGSMRLKGEDYSPATPLEANGRGVAMVTQELGLINALPAAVNIFLGNMKRFTLCGVINTRKMYEEALRQVERWGFAPFALDRRAGSMNVEERKIVEIVRALTVEPDVVIFDEVTQALSHDNRLRLYRIIQQLKTEGRTVLLISHDLDEMLRITDTVSVLRDGRLVETLRSAETTEDALKHKMVGRTLDGEYYRADRQDSHGEHVALHVEGVSTQSGLRNISFDLYEGEILGFCGLSDAGIHEVGRAIFGLEKRESGQVRLRAGGDMKPVNRAPRAARYGMAYVPKDRDGEALMIGASISNNVVLPSLEKLKKALGCIELHGAKALVDRVITTFSVKCSGRAQYMSELSGGNKQKINLGRWLAKEPKVLIVDCPTRGVDVGVKAYLYHCLRQAKENGTAVLLITDELPEAIGMSDRIMVMKNGSISRTFLRSGGFSEEDIIEVMI